MTIEFTNVIPAYMHDLTFSEQSLWKNELSLRPSERVLVNAVSGKGKTSLTNLLCGILQEYDGDLCFDNKNVKNFSFNDWTQIRKEKLSIVFQDLQLFLNLSVKENFEIIWQLKKQSYEDRAKEYCDRLGILEKWNIPCSHLSMGQRQRVAIIRSLCRSFEYLILDEPFSHLDNDNAARAMSIIDERVTELKAGFLLTTLNDVTEFSYDRQLKL